MAVENISRFVGYAGNKIGWENVGWGVAAAAALPFVPLAGIGFGTAAAVGAGIAGVKGLYDAGRAKWEDANQKIPQDLQDAANFKPYDYEGGQYQCDTKSSQYIPTPSTFTPLPFQYQTQTSPTPTSFNSQDYYSALSSNPTSPSTTSRNTVSSSYYAAPLPTVTPPTFGSLYGVAGGGGMMVNTAESVGTAAQRIERARILQRKRRKESSVDEAQTKKIKTIASASASGLVVLTVVIAAITCIVGGNTTADESSEKNKNDNSSYKTFMTVVGTATLGLGILVAVNDVVLPIVNIPDT